MRREVGNPKSEARNPKQIPNRVNEEMRGNAAFRSDPHFVKTRLDHSQNPISLFVCFGFRASDFELFPAAMKIMCAWFL